MLHQFKTKCYVTTLASNRIIYSVQNIFANINDVKLHSNFQARNLSKLTSILICRLFIKDTRSVKMISRP